MDQINRNICVVSGCGSKLCNRKKVPVHHFPVRSVGKWVSAIQNEHLKKVKNYKEITKKRLFVCRLHFSEDQFYSKQDGSVILKPDAVPYLNLSKVSITKESNIDLDTIQSSPSARKVRLILNNLSPSVGKFVNIRTENLPIEEVKESSLKLPNFIRPSEFIYTTPFSANKCNLELTNSGGLQSTPQEKTVDPAANDEFKKGSTEAGIMEIEIPQEHGNKAAAGIMEVQIAEEQGKSTSFESTLTFMPTTRGDKTRKVKYARTRNITRTIGAKREAETFSPGKKKIYDEMQKQRRQNENLAKKLKRSEKRFKNAKNILDSTKFTKLCKKLSELQRQFIEMILKNHDKDPQARRYTAEEKIICLSIYKRSPKCYRYLRFILTALLAESTLKVILRNVDIETGITNSTRQRLREAASLGKSEKDKAVILMWDELLLGLGLQYDSVADKIVGFEDWGTVRTDRFADHALVFMIRSIETGDNLPVSFNFCDSQTKSTQLQFCIKEVIKALKDAGFNVVATVCDGASTNESAINQLIEDTKIICGSEYVKRYGTFVVHNVEVIPLYDPPHLFKCIRNNLLNKDLEVGYSLKNTSKRTFAEWNHATIAYEIYSFGKGKLPALKKLTDQHIYPDKINKMTCKLCNQVFSGELSSEMQSLAGGPAWDIGEEKMLQMPLEGRDTAEVFAYFNILIDAFNGKVTKDLNSVHRTLFTDESFHSDFFTDAKRKVSKMRFVNRDTKEPLQTQPPCLRNLKKTIEGVQLLWTRLKQLGFTDLKTKHLNRDLIENFFGLIRDHGAQNNKPTCYQFIGHFKALVINNLTHHHALGANCEDDGGASLLTWKSYLQFSHESGEKAHCSSGVTPQNPTERNPKITSSNQPIPEKNLKQTTVLTKNLRTKVPFLNSCTECIKLISSQTGSSCKRTMSPLHEIHNDVNSLLRRVMDCIYTKHDVLKRAATFLKKEVRLEIVTCRTHRESLVHHFLQCCIEQYIVSTSAYLNLILKGKRKSNCEIENEEANQAPKNGAKQIKNTFVERAVRKRQASLHKKKSTYNRIQKGKC